MLLYLHDVLQDHSTLKQLKHSLYSRLSLMLSLKNKTDTVANRMKDMQQCSVI